MARSEARLSVTIWNDDDFLELSTGAQRMFMFLISQPDLAHDGVLALRERRWSKKAKGMTLADVERDLSELRATRFVVVDEDTEEVLIRSFLRRDKVYRQPNVLRAAADHLATVSSPSILAAVATELHRIAGADDIHDGSRPIVAGMLAAIGTLPEGLANPSGNPSGRVNDLDGDDFDDHESDGDVTAARNPSGTLREGFPEPLAKASVRTPGERGEVTAVRSASPFPDPRSTDPGPRPQSSTGGRAGVRETAAAGNPAGPPPPRCEDHIDHPDPPPCGRCGDARKRRERWEREQAATAARTQSERAQERAAVSRAAIDACQLCDSTGYRDARLCAHDPDQNDRVRRGASLAAAAIRRPASTTEGTTQP